MLVRLPPSGGSGIHTKRTTLQHPSKGLSSSFIRCPIYTSPLLSPREYKPAEVHAVPHCPEMGFILSQETARLVAIREPHSCWCSIPLLQGGDGQGDGCPQAKGQGGSLEVAHWRGDVRMTAFPCSWTTGLHKDSMVVDSDTTGEAVSAIYMYIYVYIGIFIDIYRMSQEQYHRGAQVFTNITFGCVSSPLQQTKSQMMNRTLWGRGSHCQVTEQLSRQA